MARTDLAGLDRTRLRLWLLLFFVLLALPTAVLIVHSYDKLKWETFHQYRVLAEELAQRIDDRLAELIDAEESRSFTDYAFLNVVEGSSSNFLQPSPLSRFPVEARIPGLMGYFQVDSDGQFSSPLLPQEVEQAGIYGVSAGEQAARRALLAEIQQVLARNSLVQSGRARGLWRPGEDAGSAQVSERTDGDLAGNGIEDEASQAKGEGAAPAVVKAQSAFDQLKSSPAAPQPARKKKAANKLGRVADLELDYSYQAEPSVALQEEQALRAMESTARQSRKELSAIPEPLSSLADGTEKKDTPQQVGVRILTFESELDPFEFSRLDSGHLVLYRKVWRDGERYIQGALINSREFVAGVVERVYRASALSRMSHLIVAYQGDVVAEIDAVDAPYPGSRKSALQGALLYQNRLSDPLSDIELILSVSRLPAGAGGRVVLWMAAVMTLVLCGGFLLMYRLGVKQIEVARQQQDFISAVSHELKTPLTSIRMYGEMLREGWASEEKKKIYYDFIFEESERLSRLINNVLQLARLTHRVGGPELKETPVSQLIDLVQSKVSSQVEAAGFSLQVGCSESAGASHILVDPDQFSQVFINLVDNAIKFSNGAATRAVEIDCRLLDGATTCFTVRDFGPGIPPDQMKKIFRLFYRTGTELTRETVGTGIGLALVHQLVLAMRGQIDVINASPGAEFRVSFPLIAGGI